MITLYPWQKEKVRLLRKQQSAMINRDTNEPIRILDEAAVRLKRYAQQKNYENLR